jgi:protein-disulfide isomerase
MKMRSKWVLVILAAVVAWGGCQQQVEEKRAEAPATVEADPAVVASVDGVPITADDLEEAAKGELQKIRAQAYQAKKRALDQLIEEKLIEKAAEKKGMRAEAYVADQVESKISEPTEEEIKAFYDQNKARIKVQFDKVKLQIAEHLKNTRVAEKKRELVAWLKEEADVKVMLEPPRTEVLLDHAAYTSGDDKAEISLIEFSDYQCPYSKRAHPTVKRVLDKYQGKISYAFFDFPLAFHKDAMKAHEAARCAGAQGKYAEYSEKLFENQANLRVEALKKHAKDLGLDAEAFDSCLESGKVAAAVNQSIAQGKEAGVSGTPAFFVNGIMLSGAQPFEAFQELVESELAR